MLPEWLEINNWSGFLSPPHGIMVSRLWFPQILVILKYPIHFYNLFPSSFHCLDFAGIWVWLREFGLWAAHQRTSTSQVLEAGAVSLLGNVQDGPLLPGTPAGTGVRWVRFISHRSAMGCFQPSQGWGSGKSIAQWDKPSLAASCPSMDKGTRASHAKTRKSLSLGASSGCGQNFPAGWFAWWRCTDKRKAFQKLVRMLRNVFCSQYSIKANLMEKRKISSSLCKEHKYPFQTIL